jgi:YD repeat-containing protein
MTNALGKTWSFGYDANKNLTSVTDPLSNVTAYGYDSLGRRTSVTLPDPAPNGATTSFSFDILDRVTQVTNPDSSYRTTTYNCCVKTKDTDENGKQTQYEYDSLDRLVKIWPADDPNKTGAPILKQYYLCGQLKSVTDRKNQSTEFTYDGGHRQRKVIYTDTTKFEVTPTTSPRTGRL